ncbi:MAG: Unknown protein [uncultured Sulfurovum sp.]|uniref:Uncharacterized protein n=1 Tax=uncultured Sulfurovum sp. TaxID=269237 RepID=A0A6S6T5P3_9BACT|nr:MAG: Unknown protein [uncultured Sulfurovum sp.]
MKKKHWIDFLEDSMAISHIFKEDKIIPNLNLIVIEDISTGFNLNSIKELLEGLPSPLPTRQTK